MKTKKKATDKNCLSSCLCNIKMHVQNKEPGLVHIITENDCEKLNKPLKYAIFQSSYLMIFTSFTRNAK